MAVYRLVYVYALFFHLLQVPFRILIFLQLVLVYHVEAFFLILNILLRAYPVSLQFCYVALELGQLGGAKYCG